MQRTEMLRVLVLMVSFFGTSFAFGGARACGGACDDVSATVPRNDPTPLKRNQIFGRANQTLFSAYSTTRLREAHANHHLIVLLTEEGDLVGFSRNDLTRPVFKRMGREFEGGIQSLFLSETKVLILSNSRSVFILNLWGEKIWESLGHPSDGKIEQAMTAGDRVALQLQGGDALVMDCSTKKPVWKSESTGHKVQQLQISYSRIGVLTLSGKLLLLQSSGIRLWDSTSLKRKPKVREFVLTDKSLTFLTEEQRVYTLDLLGKKKWSTQNHVADGKVTQIASSSKVTALLTSDGNLYVFGPGGTQLWDSENDDPHFFHPIVHVKVAGRRIGWSSEKNDVVIWDMKVGSFWSSRKRIGLGKVKEFTLSYGLTVLHYEESFSNNQKHDLP